jgi:pyruvate/2-oxoglutarate dehydrogenase complex dihydrolipoamide dehydrogenase (E3) component
MEQGGFAALPISQMFRDFTFSLPACIIPPVNTLLLPLGSMANRQGRVIGTNISGGNERFDGAVGAWGIKFCAINAAGAGLTLESALREGFDAISVQVVQADRAHFFPTKTPMSMELVVDRKTRRVLGVQGVSPAGDALAARINPVAALLSHKVDSRALATLKIIVTDSREKKTALLCRRSRQRSAGTARFQVGQDRV